MNDIQNLTAGELRKILSIKEQIEELQSSPKKIFAQICKAAAAGLSRTVLGVAVVTMTLTARAQVNFCTEIQTANSSSISYDSGLFTYTESDASEGEEHAILPLCGDAASAINSTSAWTASVSVNLSARTFAAATSHAEMGFVVSTSLSGSLGSALFVFELAQENNTGAGDGGNTDIYPDGWYGTALSFQALVNGSRDPATPLGASQATSNGSIYLLLSGGTASAGTNESIGSASGILTITYYPSNETVVGTYNGINVASYSVAGWGSKRTSAKTGQACSSSCGMNWHYNPDWRSGKHSTTPKTVK